MSASKHLSFTLKNIDPMSTKSIFIPGHFPHSPRQRLTVQELGNMSYVLSFSTANNGISLRHHYVEKPRGMKSQITNRLPVCIITRRPGKIAPPYSTTRATLSRRNVQIRYNRSIVVCQLCCWPDKNDKYITSALFSLDLDEEISEHDRNH